MRVWRICRKAFASDALSGRGGLFVAGRWHSKGHQVVYASSSLALAALELLVHADRTELPADLIQVEIGVPDDVRIDRIERVELPRNWRDYPAAEALQRIGNQWLAGMATAALQLPSAVIPEECNYLLNPLHADAQKIAVIQSAKFLYDPRLAN